MCSELHTMTTIFILFLEISVLLIYFGDSKMNSLKRSLFSATNFRMLSTKHFYSTKKLYKHDKLAALILL